MASSQPIAQQDFYVRLGLARGAADGDIRKAFLEQARVWHPDKNPSAEAAERFRLVREACDTLSSPRKRRTYDAALVSGGRSNAAVARGSHKSASSSTAKASDAAPAAPASLVALLEATQGKNGKTNSLADLRRLSTSCGVPWPVAAFERPELLAALASSARNELELRINRRNWADIAKEDIIAWLELRGCSLWYAKACDSVSKQMLITMAESFITPGDGATACRPVPTPVRSASGPPQPPPQPSQSPPPPAGTSCPFTTSAANTAQVDPGVTLRQKPRHVGPLAPTTIAGMSTWMMFQHLQAKPKKRARRGSSIARTTRRRKGAGVSDPDETTSLRAPHQPKATRQCKSEPKPRAKRQQQKHSAEDTTIKTKIPSTKGAPRCRQAARRKKVCTSSSSSSDVHGPSDSDSTSSSAEEDVSACSDGDTASDNTSSDEGTDVKDTCDSLLPKPVAVPESKKALYQLPVQSLKRIRKPLASEQVAVPVRQNMDRNDRKAVQTRVLELRTELEQHRLKMETTIQAPMIPVFKELEELDAEGKIDLSMLRATRIGVELNNGWWRRDAHGLMGRKAASLVLRWMNRCKGPPT